MGVGKLLTCGGLGVWAIVDWFLIQGATKEKKHGIIQQNFHVLIMNKTSYIFYFIRLFCRGIVGCFFIATRTRNSKSRIHRLFV